MKTKPSTQHAAEAETQTPTTSAAPMTPTTQHAEEPTPAYAFSVFVKTRPALQEIAKRTKIDTTDRTSPGLFFLQAQLALEREEPPRFTDEQHIQLMSIEPLKKRISNEQMTREEVLKIQRQILDIKVSAMAPQANHQETIRALSTALNEGEQDFQNWITTDPAGIAAAAQDKAHGEWVDAEIERKANEERDKRIEEQIERDLDALRDIIGYNLTRLDLNHPDIDQEAASKFLEWHNREWDESGELFFMTNAVLTGASGTGKTRAMAQAALWLCEEGRSAEWITGYEFAELVSDLATDRRSQANERLREITDAPTLYFDDLGSANFTAARTSRFFRLVDERYRENRPTIISTNYSTQQLKKLFATTGETKEESVRILRRIIGTTTAPLCRFFHFKRPATK